MQGAPAEQRGQSVDAGPVMHFLDEPILDRIGRDVDELVHHVDGVHEVNDTDLLACPEVFPPATPRILTLGQELVEMLRERRDVAVAIEDHGVGGGWTWRTS